MDELVQIWSHQKPKGATFETWLAQISGKTSCSPLPVYITIPFKRVELKYISPSSPYPTNYTFEPVEPQRERERSSKLITFSQGLILEVNWSDQG